MNKRIPFFISILLLTTKCIGYSSEKINTLFYNLEHKSIEKALTSFFNTQELKTINQEQLQDLLNNVRGPATKLSTSNGDSILHYLLRYKHHKKFIILTTFLSSKKIDLNCCLPLYKSINEHNKKAVIQELKTSNPNGLFCFDDKKNLASSLFNMDLQFNKSQAKNLLNTNNVKHYAPLHCAVKKALEKNDFTILNTLLNDKRINVNPLTRNNETPLDLVLLHIPQTNKFMSEYNELEEISLEEDNIQVQLLYDLHNEKKLSPLQKTIAKLLLKKGGICNNETLTRELETYRIKLHQKANEIIPNDDCFSNLQRILTECFLY